MKKLTTYLGLMLILGFTQSCGDLSAYNPENISKNTVKFGKNTEKIDKEINKGIKALRLEFEALLQLYVDIDLAALIARNLAGSNKAREALENELEDQGISSGDQEKILTGFDDIINSLDEKSLKKFFK